MQAQHFLHEFKSKIKNTFISRFFVLGFLVNFFYFTHSRLQTMNYNKQLDGSVFQSLHWSSLFTEYIPVKKFTLFSRHIIHHTAQLAITHSHFSQILDLFHIFNLLSAETVWRHSPRNNCLHFYSYFLSFFCVVYFYTNTTMINTYFL